MDKKENEKNRKKEERMFESKQQNARKTLKEIKESYEIGIEYYQDVEEHED